jgi:phosphoribosylformylglycinamidine cyclo-ligase
MTDKAPSQGDAYARAGVDIDAGNAAKRQIGDLVASTRRPEVLADMGGFGGLFALAPLGLRDPVLVASTDGVGTKLKVALALDRHDTVGSDLVNHCVDDILTCGARPLFFLDYLALGAGALEHAPDIVAGVAAGCRAAGCALIGGETAQMPELYGQGEYDLAGTIIGVVERDAIVTGQTMRAGDVAIGLPSAGLHTNGYTLARRVFAGDDWHDHVPEVGASLGEALLAPHLSYLAPVRRMLDDPDLAGMVTGMAHITGGGLIENIPRIVPKGLGVDLDARRWEILPIFRLIQQRGAITWDETARVFNLGIGYVVFARPEAADAALAHMADAGARIIGTAVERAAGPCVRVEGLPE